MAYKWEKESLQKYGEEVTRNLIIQQKRHEEMHKDNDCENCGKGNKGAMIEPKNGEPFILHFGLWSSSGRCWECGRIVK
ncbi:hypothetical protein [Bacillus pseudomycoides]|nr:hypothetical protein [Bacillus pseudomycoides]KFN13751.1 hypothetical protein DJ94_4509 [Bacillus pseudomycoides]MDR4188113.1 hypothetical protein [Bacillus pseudomycoides]MED0856360.1 hypothetical protein [Bacillus pseudomycoides]PEK70415.1 hypothetical protein CN593_05195 [Bacillus pseudomycoides]PEN08602.1 hypothetical protein CN640_13265 [Bacillus pseudomycoides]